MFEPVIYYQKLVPEAVGKNISAKVWSCVWWMLLFCEGFEACWFTCKHNWWN